MPRKTKIYVASVALLALAWGWLLYLSAPNLSNALLSDALLMCALAVTAEFLGYLMPRSAVGSFGFIPYFAAAIIVPAWPSVRKRVLIKALAEIFTSRKMIKKTLNVSAYAVMELTAVLVYVVLGGTSFRSIPVARFTTLRM
jgi:hypothetical protein